MFCQRSGSRQKLTEMARTDASPVVRLYLASATQRLPLEQRWDAHDNVTEVWGPDRQRIKQHHVFLRLPG